jgi:hypothetical protein
MARPAMPYVLGYFSDPHYFKEACEASTASGHVGHEGFAPYPVHGVERALGLRRSWIGRVVLFMLLFGALCGFLMQLWMLKYDWPVIIGGKPYNSWPAFVVITFESGILCGALTNLLVCLLVACRILPSLRTVLPDDRLTDDLFCLAVPVTEHGSIAGLDDWMKARHGVERVEHYLPEGQLANSSEVHHA